MYKKINVGLMLNLKLKFTYLKKYILLKIKKLPPKFTHWIVDFSGSIPLKFESQFGQTMVQHQLQSPIADQYNATLWMANRNYPQ